MGEHISEIFSTKAKEGETVRQWCGRARERFDRRKRKTGVSFPEEAQGWILLQCSGMTEEQRAVVLARTQADLKFDAMSTQCAPASQTMWSPSARPPLVLMPLNQELPWTMMLRRL